MYGCSTACVRSVDRHHNLRDGITLNLVKQFNTAYSYAISGLDWFNELFIAYVGNRTNSNERIHI